MPVGLLIAMAPREPTSHGFTSRAEKVVWGSMGARILPLLEGPAVGLIRVAGWPRAIREGTASLGTNGSSSSRGDNFLLLREACESRESGSDAEGSLPASDEACDSETPGELDPGWSDPRLIVDGAAMRRDGGKGRGCDLDQTETDRPNAWKLFAGRDLGEGPRAKVFHSLAARIGRPRRGGQGARGIGEVDLRQGREASRRDGSMEGGLLATVVGRGKRLLVLVLVLVPVLALGEETERERRGERDRPRAMQ
jgi:hypothetical protein